LALLVIRSADLARSEAFYRAFGLEFQREQHGRGPIHLAAELAGLIFEIYPLGSQPATAGTRIGFRVSSIEAGIAALAGLGGTIEQPAMESEWGRRAVVRDPDGHTVELLEPVLPPNA